MARSKPEDICEKIRKTYTNLAKVWSESETGITENHIKNWRNEARQWVIDEVKTEHVSYCYGYIVGLFDAIVDQYGVNNDD